MNKPTTPRERFPLRWSSANSKNFAYTTGDGKGLFISIGGSSFYFRQRRITKGKRRGK